MKISEIATTNGATALGLARNTGVFEPGFWFDFVAINLKSARLNTISDFESNEGAKKVLDALIFGCGNSEVLFTGVAGIIKFFGHKVPNDLYSQPQ